MFKKRKVNIDELAHKRQRKIGSLTIEPSKYGILCCTCKSIFNTFSIRKDNVTSNNLPCCPKCGQDLLYGKFIELDENRKPKNEYTLRDYVNSGFNND